MPWLQLTLTIERTQAPGVEMLFEALGALSVTYADAEDQPLLEPAPGETPLWRKTHITALFDSETDPAPLGESLSSALPGSVRATLEQSILADRVWERVWMDDFKPMCFGRRLWICPAGQRPDAQDAVCVDLDPGLAFGTGTHPTTALCLGWLDAAELKGKTVLDFGCGSGVLGIAAARLGARRVVAVDHDPQAIEATLANAEKNQVRAAMEIMAPGQTPAGGFDLVLANILAGTLVELSPLIGQRVAAGGHLLLSGILPSQVQQVEAAYQGAFHFGPPAQDADWVLLHGSRRAS